MRRNRKLLVQALAAAVGLVVGGTASAQHRHCPPPPCQVVQPPCEVAPTPAPPTTPPTTPPDQQPEQRPQPEVEQPSSLTQAAPGGTGSSGSLNPTMFGDQFGGSASQGTMSLGRFGIIAGNYSPISTSFNSQTGDQPLSFSGETLPVTGLINPVSPQEFARLRNAAGRPLSPSELGQPIGTSTANVPFTTVQPLRQIDSISNPGFVVIPVTDNATARLLATQLLAGGSTGQLQFDAANSALVGRHVGAELQTSAVEYTYNFMMTGPGGIPLFIPNPAGGGVVGRTKISDDNSPMPRDRIIAGYDYYDNVTLTPGGLNVHRYSPGIEKTFFDRRASVEVRFPFASTLSSDLNTNGLTSTNTEFGNINVTLKALLYRSDDLNIATGMGISLPTADDTRVRTLDGTEVVRVSNDAVLLSPYVAALYTPNDRVFAQAWSLLSVDANGNPVQGNLDMIGLQQVGRLTDASVLQLDAQIGYWLYKSEDPSSILRGLAPFVELHYNTTVSDPDAVQAGLFSVRDVAGRIDELNLTVGAISQLGDNFILSVGAVAPLKTGDNRVFDYQVGIRANYFFGPTARARDRATPVSNF